jgi:hypothetical protein
VAKVSLAWRPDDALYASARALLDRIIAWGKSEGQREHALALSLLGRFLLDSYFANKTGERYADYFAAWQTRRRTYEHIPAQPMPEPIDVLREAADALREAAGLLDGEEAAKVWKELVEALHLLAIIDPDAAAHGADDADVVAAATSALKKMDPARDDNLIPTVQFALAEHQGRLARSGPTSVPPPELPASSQTGESLDALAERIDKVQAIGTGLQRFSQALEHDPEGAGVILADTWRLAADYGNQDLRREVLHAHGTLLIRELPPELKDRTRPLADRVGQLDTALSGADSAAVARALLGLAAISGSTNDELLGMDLVNRALKLDPSISQWMPMQLTYLMAALRWGHACNLGTARQLAEAIEAYGSAADTFIDCGLSDMARQCVQRIAVNASADTLTAIATVHALGRLGLKLGRSLDSDTNALIAQALRTSSSELTTGPNPPTVPVLRDELAKGLMLGAAIATPAPVTLDDYSRQLLREVEVLDREAAAATITAAEPASDFDKEVMLVSYVAPSEATPGRNAAEVAINLKRTFDEHFATELYGRAGNAAWATVDQLQSSLDARTLLMSIFLGSVPDKRLAVQVQALTNNSHDLAVIPLDHPSGLVQVEHSGVTLWQSPLAPFVTNLRLRIQEDPLFGAVDHEAGDTLAKWLPMFFGPFAARLADWHSAGLDHLVVWPQGPLHYLPWHLFDCPATKRPLAEDWIVTILPSVACLTQPPQPPGAGLVAAGCADAGLPYNLPSVPSMPQQAQAIAQAFGVAPLNEPEATPAEVLRRVAGARYLHLATHGSHVEQAPAFQCVYLTPNASTGDGRLFAYEVAGADLRGAELVTLSACESALGRFDLADNLRGMPAAFLAAGASAVIGALWPVGRAAATTFFTTLYAQLGAQADKLVAYRAAQTATRHTHPEYRDWGAFCYVGDWR